MGTPWEFLVFAFNTMSQIEKHDILIQWALFRIGIGTSFISRFSDLACFCSLFMVCVNI